MSYVFIYTYFIQFFILLVTSGLRIFFFLPLFMYTLVEYSGCTPYVLSFTLPFLSVRVSHFFLVYCHGPLAQPMKRKEERVVGSRGRKEKREWEESWTAPTVARLFFHRFFFFFFFFSVYTPIVFPMLFLLHLLTSSLPSPSDGLFSFILFLFIYFFTLFFAFVVCIYNPRWRLIRRFFAFHWQKIEQKIKLRDVKNIYIYI